MTDTPEAFQREERYIVIKRKHLTNGHEADIRAYLSNIGVSIVDCAVVEDDWPEYETVWEMIEARCTPRGEATINQSSIVGHPFSDGDIHLCWACGALPCDGGVEAWRRLPWVVTKKDSGGWRFLIDSRDPENSDMFSGFYLCTDGRLGEAMQRYNYHRSHFEEALPD